MIQKRSDMTIKSEKNYLKHIKQSGYRSYHLIIYYTVETINGPKRIQAEIQIHHGDEFLGDDRAFSSV